MTVCRSRGERHSTASYGSTFNVPGSTFNQAQALNIEPLNLELCSSALESSSIVAV